MSYLFGLFKSFFESQTLNVCIACRHNNLVKSVLLFNVQEFL